MRRYIAIALFPLLLLLLFAGDLLAAQDMNIRYLQVQQVLSRLRVTNYLEVVYSGTYADAFKVDYTGSGNYVLHLLGDSSTVFTVDKSGNVVAAGSFAPGSLLIPDTDASNTLQLKWNENDSSDRILNFLVNGGDRSLTIESDSVLDQDVSTGGSPAFAGRTITGIITDTPSAAQVIDDPGDTIVVDGPIVELNPDGSDPTLTSTPTIADGTKGDIVRITCANGEANTVTIQDEGALGGSNIQLLGDASSKDITGQSVVSLWFDGTDWIEFGGASVTADYVWTNSYNPLADGADNDTVEIGSVDATNNRLYNRTTGVQDTQDMDWYGEKNVNGTPVSLTLFTRASDFANCVMTMTIEDQAQNPDATGAVVITPTGDATWEEFTYTFTSAYVQDEEIFIKIAITSLDTADTIDFGRCKINY